MKNQDIPPVRNASSAWLESTWRWAALLFGVCLLAYAPAFNNGFISDDYVFLERVEEWKHDPLFLFSIPPENFRATTYAAFLILKKLFGYEAGFYYGFTLLVHFLNVLLMWRLFCVLSPTLAPWAALFFASLQNPQEAVMWLGGMHEVLLGFFSLLVLLLWVQNRYVLATLAYAAALFTKESAVILPLLIALFEYWKSSRFPHLRLLALLLLPTLLFLGVMLYTLDSNSLAAGGFYRPGLHAVPVFANSIHRLAFPWLYVAVFLKGRVFREALSQLQFPLLWMATALLPYIFLTYQNHVPSRHLYLASLGLCAALANLIAGYSGRARQMLALLFVTGNIGYLWAVKDDQFEVRAAPTAQLVEHLRSVEPQSLLIENFPLNPWIARLATRATPPWSTEDLHVNEPRNQCKSCPVLRWEPKQKRYLYVEGRPSL